MAEYFSLGRNDALTAMWMRDAVMRNKFPTVKQLTTDPRFFPYRYGQALWAYVGGKWGDRAIIDIYRSALRVGWDAALVRGHFKVEMKAQTLAGLFTLVVKKKPEGWRIVHDHSSAGEPVKK